MSTDSGWWARRLGNAPVQQQQPNTPPVTYHAAPAPAYQQQAPAYQQQAPTQQAKVAKQPAPRLRPRIYLKQHSIGREARQLGRKRTLALSVVAPTSSAVLRTWLEGLHPPLFVILVVSMGCLSKGIPRSGKVLNYGQI